MGPPDSHGIPRDPRYSGYSYASEGFRVRDFHPLRSGFPDGSANLPMCDLGVLQPREGRNLPGLGFSPFARHYLGNHVCFLFLPVLRCFSSRGSPPYLSKDDRPSACRVAPFRNPRIKGRLHLPEAYRSLPRLSSPTRAKASAMCPFLLSPSRNISVPYINTAVRPSIYLQLST